MKKTHSLGTFFSVLFVGAALSFSASRAHAQMQYSVDDGTAEDSVGLTNGGTFIALNSFTVTGGFNIINSIDIAWGTPAFPDPSLNGLSYTAFLWSDPNGDGNPVDGQLLASSAPGIISNAGTDTFLTSTISPTAVLTPDFFVGFVITHSAGQFPAAFDETAPVPNRSFITLGSDPNDLSGAAPIEVVTGGALVGNWLIRADASAVPEPSSWAMIGLGGALLIGFMRFRARVS